MQDPASKEPSGSELKSITDQHSLAANGDLATYFLDIDLDRPGKHCGFVYFPHSPHDDAWGTVRVPIAVISHGPGPTVLLEGGNHGDEYEGPITIGELMRELSVEHVRGRIIFIPAINAPAVNAGSRTSPIDGKNMNRVFPGDHAGTITEQIAAFVNDELLPRADAFLSLHSGGSSLNIVPSTIVIPSADPEQFSRCLQGARAFEAPMSVVMNMLGDRRLCVSAAMNAGLTCVSTEMAGGGLVNPQALELCRQGTRRVLALWGVIQQPEARGDSNHLARSDDYYGIESAHAYVIASEEGVFEPAVSINSEVCKGDLAGYIHFLTAPQKAPVALYFAAAGRVYATRQYGVVRPGNTCAVVASIKPIQ